MRVQSVKLGILISFLIYVSCEYDTAKNERDISLFEKISTEQSGVSFINHITSSDSINILDFNVIFNGGGVAVGDINNDGLVDLYFTVNQNSNRLYLNNGDMTFIDITQAAGVEGTSDWSTGTTMADVNGDGYLDIYTTAISGFDQLEGRNELFINNGDRTFTEKGGAFGVDIKAFSNHAAFFDYDHDGDLDLYILNVSLRTAHGRIPNAAIRHSVDRQAGDMLLRNENGRFTDVSRQAGIFQGPTGFGLGLAVADFNNDQWEDIYISNDFFEDDYLYINNRNGTFSESGKVFFKHFSYASMGNDAADYNNDGFTDLVILDMLPEDEYTEKTTVGEDPPKMNNFKQNRGYYHQVARNTFQLNNAGRNFSDIAPILGVEATDWSWAALLADFNLDGVKDLFVSNGIPRRANSLSYVSFYQNAVNSRRGHVNLDEFYRQSIEQMPDGKVTDYLFEGSRELMFKNRSGEWGMEETSYSNGAAYADLDNDGDLDLVINRLFDTPVIYRNRARELTNHNYVKVKLNGEPGNTTGIGAKVFLYENGELQLHHQMHSRGFLSSVDPILNFGLHSVSGDIDSIRVVWDHQYEEIMEGVQPNQTIIFEKKNAELKEEIISKKPLKLFTIEEIIKHKHEENEFRDYKRQPLIPFQVSQEGPALAVADVNQDGRDDFYIGGAKIQPGALWVQQPNGSFLKSEQEIFKSHSVFEDVDALFFDANGDGFKDLYVVSGGNEFYGQMEQQFDRLYINDGSGNYSYDAERLPEMFVHKSVVAPTDFDDDGDTDLFVGGRVVANGYGITPKSYLLLNKGNGYFEDYTGRYSDDLQQVGMVTDAAWADMNDDGREDLIVAGEFMPVTVFYHEGSTLRTVEIKDRVSGRVSSGLWQSLEITDADEDGNPDILAGNLGGNHIFKRPRGEGRLRMYVHNFEQAGLTDQILTYDRYGDWYPIHRFEELNRSIPSALDDISGHLEYADKPIDQLVHSSKLKEASQLQADMLESALIQNHGDGSFSIEPLPVQAQFAPIFDFLVDDVNDDGQADIIAGGNKYGVSIHQASYNASVGTLLLGTAEDGYKSVNPIKAGILLEGEVRNIKKIWIGGDKHVAVTVNDEELRFFSYTLKAEQSPSNRNQTAITSMDP